jgi:hypothetical protein
MYDDRERFVGASIELRNCLSRRIILRIMRRAEDAFTSGFVALVD